MGKGLGWKVNCCWEKEILDGPNVPGVLKTKRKRVRLSPLLYLLVFVCTYASLDCGDRVQLSYFFVFHVIYLHREQKAKCDSDRIL